jgi:hypothetical protein
MKAEAEAKRVKLKDKDENGMKNKTLGTGVRSLTFDAQPW